MVKNNAAPSSSRGRNKALERMLAEGQSVWLDQLTRELVRGGDLQALIERDGLRGMTLRPIRRSSKRRSRPESAYDEQIRESLSEKGLEPEARSSKPSRSRTYATLTISFGRFHEKSACLDGYVSIEVKPSLEPAIARGTVAEARRLWSLVDRPNVMIKVPGTKRRSRRSSSSWSKGSTST